MAGLLRIYSSAIDLMALLDLLRTCFWNKHYCSALSRVRSWVCKAIEGLLDWVATASNPHKEFARRPLNWLVSLDNRDA